MARNIIHNCVDCGKPRKVLILYGKPRFLRCVKCANRSRVYNHYMEKAPGWKGGRHITKKGYVYVRLLPDDFFHPMVKQNGYVLEHRLVVAKALGRCLHDWEIVHHKGDKYPRGSREDKGDNRYPENLELTTRGNHVQEHNKGYSDGYWQGYQDGQSKLMKKLKEQIRLLQQEIRQTKGIS